MLLLIPVIRHLIQGCYLQHPKIIKQLVPMRVVCCNPVNQRIHAFVPQAASSTHPNLPLGLQAREQAEYFPILRPYLYNFFFCLGCQCRDERITGS